MFNITGTSRFGEQGLRAGRLVFYGTDPVHPELLYASGDAMTRQIVDEHDDVVTYGENIGVPGCMVPPLPNLRARMRQPILTDMWAAEADAPTRPVFTTVGNWAQSWRDAHIRARTTCGASIMNG